MPSQNFLSLILISLACGAWAISQQRRSRLARRSAFEDRLLWVGLAAGLFDSDECPATSRLEIALAAVARKLGLRAGIVTVHGRERCTVVATAALEAAMLRGLTRGTEVARSSLYCGTLSSRGQSLAIDYAGVTEWRRHAGYRERGWETYLAVNCGLEQGEDVVVAFFDTVPRSTVFTRAERALVEQLAPWIASMVSDHGAESRGEAPRRAETEMIPRA